MPPQADQQGGGSGMAKVFRYKREIGVNYADQGFIYFLSRRYQLLPSEKKGLIRQVCREAAGSDHKAVCEYVTTDSDSTHVCTRHALSESTLERMVRRYYRILSERI